MRECYPVLAVFYIHHVSDIKRIIYRTVKYFAAIVTAAERCVVRKILIMYRLNSCFDFCHATVLKAYFV